MVNWSSEAEMAYWHHSVSFNRFIHCFIGAYIWEWVLSLDFEWQYISGKKKFRWPMIFYFLNRYCLVAAIIGNAVVLNVTTQINCQALYTFNQCLGNSAIGLATINLSIRTMTIWSRRWFVVAPLVIMILIHLSLLFYGVVSKGIWLPDVGCASIEMGTKSLAAAFIFSMVFDFIILMLTGYKLCNPAVGHTKLVVLIFNDGLFYFAIAFLVNVLATVFILLGYIPVNFLPAAIASTTIAGRVVRRLNNFTPQDDELCPTTQGFTAALLSKVFTFRSKRSATILKPVDGVYVHTEISKSPNESNLVESDVTGKVIAGDKFDPEAQVVSQEFKRPPY